jgi:hypothetical protein
VGLSGAGGDVLEVGVVVQHHGAVVLGYRGGQEIDDPGGTVMAPCGHSDLDLARPLGDRLVDRQVDEQATAAFGDGADVTGVPSGVSGASRSTVTQVAATRSAMSPAITVLTEGSLRACAEVSIR